MDTKFTLRDEKAIVIILITLCLPSLTYFTLNILHSGGINLLLVTTAVIFLLMAPNAQLQVSWTFNVYQLVWVKNTMNVNLNLKVLTYSLVAQNLLSVV